MTERVIKLAPVVSHRCCPDCGYIMTRREIELIRIVAKCPKGCDRTINDFQPLRFA